MLNASSNYPTLRPAKLLRWSTCFTVVLFAHVIGAMALMRSLEDDSEFDAGAPVVMLELPDAPATMATPANDLEPGPVEPESEATPPQEDVRPPEQEAEVAIPEPEPPKPQPPSEARPQTAQPSVVMQESPTPPTPGTTRQTSMAFINRWENSLVAHITRFKRYPAAARARDEHGTTVVAFTLDRDGWVRNSRIVQSSGSRALDEESLAMLARAQPMPRPPDQIADRGLVFRVPVEFSIH
jgi:protein TonB